MGISNPGFETVGLYPGAAEHWTLSGHTALQGVAGFGSTPALGWEGFERWYRLLLDLADIPTVRAFFDSLVEGLEDFEEAWSNDVLLTELPTGRVTAASFHGHPVEDLEAAWDNLPFAWSWDDTSAQAAGFDGESHEDYEDGWQGNGQYAWLWSSVPSDVALFDSGATPHESFGGTWAPTTTI